MNFWLDPSLFSKFFASDEHDLVFREAVEVFTQKIFGLTSHQFFPQHQKMLQELRNLLSPANIASHHAEAVACAIEEEMDRFAAEHLEHTQELELELLTQQIMFHAALRVVYGQFFRKKFGNRVFDLFFVFDDNFELAASPIPNAFLRTFSRARNELLEIFQYSLCHDSEDRLVGSRDGNMLQGAIVERALNVLTTSSTNGQSLAHLHPNLLLTILWAVQANTLQGTYWTLGYLLCPGNEEYIRDIRRLVEGQPTSGAASLSTLGRQCCTAVADRKNLLHCCAAEGIRLSAPGTEVRKAVRDFTAPNSLHVRKGELVALCPYISSMDARRVPGADPEQFKPLRYLHCEPTGVRGNSKRVVREEELAGLAFGGGKYRCPGKYLAFTEISLFLALLLAKFDIRLVPGGSETRNSALPPIDHSTLVGLKKPSGPCPIQIVPRPAMCGPLSSSKPSRHM